MKESALEAQIVAWCRTQKILTYKFSSPARRGVPDRIFIKSGKILFVELKAPGNVPTALQDHELGTLTAAGMTAIWADNLAVLKRYLTVFFEYHHLV